MENIPDNTVYFMLFLVPIICYTLGFISGYLKGATKKIN